MGIAGHEWRKGRKYLYFMSPAPMRCVLLRGKGKQREAEEKWGCLAFINLIWLIWNGEREMGQWQSKSRNLELNVGFLCGWQGSKYFDNELFPCRSLKQQGAGESDCSVSMQHLWAPLPCEAICSLVFWPLATADLHVEYPSALCIPGYSVQNCFSVV